MSILIGGPHLYVDQTPPEGPRAAGYADGLAGEEHPSQLYDRTERAAYYKGYCRGALARIAEERRTARERFTESRKSA